MTSCVFAIDGATNRVPKMSVLRTRAIILRSCLIVVYLFFSSNVVMT